MSELERADLVESLRERAVAGATASQLLRFLALDQGIHQQIVWMELFAEAFNSNLGALTALGAWWFEGERELNDEDLDSYVQYVIEEWLAARH